MDSLTTCFGLEHAAVVVILTLAIGPTGVLPQIALKDPQLIDPVRTHPR